MEAAGSVAAAIAAATPIMRPGGTRPGRTIAPRRTTRTEAGERAIMPAPSTGRIIVAAIMPAIIHATIMWSTTIITPTVTTSSTTTAIAAGATTAPAGSGARAASPATAPAGGWGPAAGTG